jgi:hypothetical protein
MFNKKEYMKEYNKKYYQDNIEKQLEKNKKFKEKNPDYFKENFKQRYLENPNKFIQKSKKYRDENPWKIDFTTMLQRTTNPKHVRFENYKDKFGDVTVKDFEEIWNRDKAYLMEQPEIDRIDNDKGYFKDNIQYLERVDHLIKSSKERIRNKRGMFIKKRSN